MESLEKQSKVEANGLCDETGPYGAGGLEGLNEADVRLGVGCHADEQKKL